MKVTAPIKPKFLDAILSADVTAVQREIEAGTNIEAVDEIGRTPLFHAAAYSSREVVDVLLLAGANKNHLDDCGNTAAAEAYLAGDFGLAKKLTPAI